LPLPHRTLQMQFAGALRRLPLLIARLLRHRRHSQTSPLEYFSVKNIKLSEKLLQESQRVGVASSILLPLPHRTLQMQFAGALRRLPLLIARLLRHRRHSQTSPLEYFSIKNMKLSEKHLAGKFGSRRRLFDPIAVPEICCSLFASPNFDRGYSLAFLHPPPAAVGSLPT